MAMWDSKGSTCAIYGFEFKTGDIIVRDMLISCLFRFESQ